MAEPDVPSPCVDVCRMDPRTGLCEGCLRTIDEIAAWSTLAADEKLAIWDRLAGRKQPLGSSGTGATTR